MSSVFGFDSRSNGNGNGWNYSRPEEDGYTPSITGDVVKLRTSPATKFNSQEIDRWDDGTPKMNFVIVIRTADMGDVDWTFSPGGVKKPSRAMAACREALNQKGIQSVSLEDLAGMNITVQTKEPPQGFTYGAGSPRPWKVTINGPGNSMYEGIELWKEEDAQPQAAPAPRPTPTNQPMSKLQQTMQQTQQTLQNNWADDVPPYDDWM